MPSGVPSIDELGLVRETLRVSLHATYDLPSEHSIDFVFGVNDQKANWVRDFDLSGFPGGFSSDPQSLEDTSYELRITSPQDNKMRWSAGVNYYEQEFTSSLQGGT